MNIAVLGTGSWGTALAQVLADNGHTVVMYGINNAEVEDIDKHHRNSKYFGDVLIHENIRAFNDIKCVENADAVICAVPTAALESVLSEAIPHFTKKVLVINVAKGFHPVSHERLSVVIRRLVPTNQCEAIVSLIGPSHAEEVIIRKLTAVNAVSEDENACRKVQKMFSNSTFRVYRNIDVIGAETGVALKNIMAIASGILEGIGQGDNARAALMTRGLAEMTRYGVLAGGKQETFLGLDGVGDLIVTCQSRHSRNFMAGLEIGKAGTAMTFMKTNKKTVEGIPACKVVHEEAVRMGIEMPITDQMYAVLFEEKDPRIAVEELMLRDLRSETDLNYSR